MNRKKFIQKIGYGAVTAPLMPAAFTSCSKDTDAPTMDSSNLNCQVSPAETAGPFTTKTPTERIRENIVGNREGIPLVINFTILDSKNDCAALTGVTVDVWQCDAKGNYSEYNNQLDGDFTSENFLRGRQTTNDQGKVTFVSIYPGWYPGRAPHLHVEIKRGNTSLLITQVAFPEDVSQVVYGTTGYKGAFDTSNSQDFEFRNSLSRNIADTLTGDTSQGYTLTKTITV